MKQKKDGTLGKSAFLAREDRQRFIDQVFLPSAKLALKDAVFNKLCSSFSKSEWRGTNGSSSMFIRTKFFKQVISEMRGLVIRHRNSLKDFQDFFFITASFGGKEPVELVDGKVELESIGSGDVDWSEMGQDLSKCKIDFGTDLEYGWNNGSTFFMSSDEAVRGKKFGELHSSYCGSVRVQIPL
jgi:hypothetical protein